MTKPQKTLLLVLSFMLCSTTFAQQHEYNKLHTGGQLGERVSLLQLIANPATYEGKRVRIRGFLHFEFEDSAIYLHKEDSDHMLSDNAVWANLPEDLSPDLAKQLNNHYVNCEGVFTAKSRGHMGAFTGELSDIHLLSISLSRAELDKLVGH